MFTQSDQLFCEHTVCLMSYSVNIIICFTLVAVDKQEVQSLCFFMDLHNTGRSGNYI